MDILEYMFQLLLQIIGWIFRTILNLAFRIIQIVFTNVYAFAIAVIIVAVIWGVNYCGSNSNRPSANTELYQSSTMYVCTARKTLKVREAPSLSAKTIGNLKSGEEVEVYEIIDGFARIRYNGSDGYASTNYLKQKK